MTSEDVPRPDFPKVHASWRFSTNNWEDTEKLLEGYEYYLCREISPKSGNVHYHALTLEHYQEIIDRTQAYMAIHIKPGKDGKRAPGYSKITNGTFESALSYFLKDGDFRTTFAIPYHDYAKKWVKRVQREQFWTLTETNVYHVIRQQERKNNIKFKYIDEAIEWLYENTDYRASRVLRETGIPTHVAEQFAHGHKRGWARGAAAMLTFRIPQYRRPPPPPPTKEPTNMSMDTFNRI